MMRFEGSPNNSFFLSEILGKKVFDLKEHRLGVLEDIFVNTSATYPKAVAILIRQGRQTRTIPWSQVNPETFLHKHIQLKVPSTDLYKFEIHSSIILPLRKAVLDKQIMDLHGAKVVRANDIHLLRSGQEMCVTDVDIGLRGLLRRLGTEAAIDKALRLIRPQTPYLQAHKFVSWRFVQPVFGQKHGSLQLTVPKEEFNLLNPADLADILEELDHEQRKSLLDHIPDEMAAKILSETDVKTTQEILEVQDEDRAADILEQMPPDKAADVLGDMQQEKAEDIISKMETKEAEAVAELLEHPDDTAGGLMTTEYQSFSPNTLVVSAIQDLIRSSKDEIETIYDAFIVDSGKLVGSITLRDLLIAPGHKPISEIMNPKPISITPDKAVREVAETFSKYNLLALPVTRENGELEGIITVDDVVEQLITRW